jgi:hypothetical protein
MELIAIQVSGVVALLLGHVIGVMRNRRSKARSSPFYFSAGSWVTNCPQLRRNRNSACTTLANRRGIRASTRHTRR